MCGTFSDWKKIPMVKSHKDFVALINLPVGEHQYKFMVDDQWMHDANQPTVKNEIGTKNNVIKVIEVSVLPILIFKQTIR